MNSRSINFNIEQSAAKEKTIAELASNLQPYIAAHQDENFMTTSMNQSYQIRQINDSLKAHSVMQSYLQRQVKAQKNMKSIAKLRVLDREQKVERRGRTRPQSAAQPPVTRQPTTAAKEPESYFGRQTYMDSDDEL